MSFADLSYLEVNAVKHQYTVIWLHGLGADGYNFLSIVPELKLPESLGIRFIFPHAPVMPVTINQGLAMRAWFDIYELSLQAKIDEKGIMQSVKSVQALIIKENAKGILSSHIFLAGFSQGAVVALTTGLLHSERLGGVLALSGFLPLADKLIARANPSNRTLPIFVAHGTVDEVLPFALGEMTYHALHQAGYLVTWHAYPMAHSVCDAEIRDISSWLQGICG